MVAFDQERLKTNISNLTWKQDNFSCCVILTVMMIFVRICVYLCMILEFEALYVVTVSAVHL